MHAAIGVKNGNGAAIFRKFIKKLNETLYFFVNILYNSVEGNLVSLASKGGNYGNSIIIGSR